VDHISENNNGLVGKLKVLQLERFLYGKAVAEKTLNYLTLLLNYLTLLMSPDVSLWLASLTTLKGLLRFNFG
jgi:hypothetical protein